MPVVFKTGNIFDTKYKTLINPVNCVGVMGKGLALNFKTKYPDMYKDYKQKCLEKSFKMGEPYIYKTSVGINVVLFPTKNHWSENSKLPDIKSGLLALPPLLAVWGITEVACPALGCGLGSLDWFSVRDLIKLTIENTSIKMEVYGPIEV